MFAAGLEEMLFPNAMSINTREELEEERRLFYVVITRAKSRLWVTYANTRYKFGSLVQNEPSRFLNELPEKYLDRSFAGGGSRNQGAYGHGSSAFDRMNRGFGGWQSKSQTENETSASGNKKPSYLSPISRPQTKEHVPSADFVASDISNLQVGQKVAQTDEMGFIKFGSRVDLLLPVGTKINVELNQEVQGGVTVIATL